MAPRSRPAAGKSTRGRASAACTDPPLWHQLRVPSAPVPTAFSCIVIGKVVGELSHRGNSGSARGAPRRPRPSGLAGQMAKRRRRDFAANAGPSSCNCKELGPRSGSSQPPNPSDNCPLGPTPPWHRFQESPLRGGSSSRLSPLCGEVHRRSRVRPVTCPQAPRSVPSSVGIGTQILFHPLLKLHGCEFK